MSSLDMETLELTAFTAELIQMKLEEITELENSDLSVAERGDKLDIVCSELGELALGVPASQVNKETEELHTRVFEPSKTAELTAQSVIDYGEQLAELLPFAAEAIRAGAKESAACVGASKEQGLNEDEEARLKLLDSIDSVLTLPITSDRAANRLLSYFIDHQYEYETDNYNVEHHSPLPLSELNRQLTEQDPMARLKEYFVYFTDYPIEIEVLAETAYTKSASPPQAKCKVISLATHPTEFSGEVLQADLASAGIVLQHGWKIESNGDGKAVRKPVIRSLNISVYDPAKHVGDATDGTSVYQWQELCETTVSRVSRP